MSDARVIRDRIGETSAALDRARADRPPFGSARMLVQVYNGGSMPKVANAVYLTHPVELDGSECEGCTATPDVGTPSVPVVMLGVPDAGDIVTAYAVGGRWVSEATRPGVPACPVSLVPVYCLCPGSIETTIAVPELGISETTIGGLVVNFPRPGTYTVTTSSSMLYGDTSQSIEINCITSIVPIFPPPSATLCGNIANSDPGFGVPAYDVNFTLVPTRQEWFTPGTGLFSGVELPIGYCKMGLCTDNSVPLSPGTPELLIQVGLCLPPSGFTVVQSPGSCTPLAMTFAVPPTIAFNPSCQGLGGAVVTIWVCGEEGDAALPPIVSESGPPAAGPSTVQAVAEIAAMKRCPYRAVWPKCGCSGARCGLRSGAVVSHLDCFECVRRYDTEGVARGRP